MELLQRVYPRRKRQRWWEHSTRYRFPTEFFSASEISSGQATSILSSRLRPPSFRLWFRLCTHALLLESRIFPDIELHDESLGYVPTGFTDIWKGKFDGEPVCVKAIRTQDPIRLREIESVCSSFVSLETYSASSVLDLLLRSRWARAHFPSERTLHH